MINPNVRAKDRIYSELPEELKALMRKYILSEDEHNLILQDIKKQSYANKKPVSNPTFYIVTGQTGSGKSNLTSYLYSKEENVVVIDSDKYKAYRPDSQEILDEHLAEYAFLTAPDSYLQIVLLFLKLHIPLKYYILILLHLQPFRLYVNMSLVQLKRHILLNDHLILLGYLVYMLYIYLNL